MSVHVMSPEAEALLWQAAHGGGEWTSWHFLPGPPQFEAAARELVELGLVEARQDQARLTGAGRSVLFARVRSPGPESPIVEEGGVPERVGCLEGRRFGRPVR